eukprot:TRINITY_DN1213_c0_g1_i1.p1 TRINITY_DN1213_c0_g1~~TRINITY_DN1213_c0_g1_i1.p1  ORF type:complete len:1305 (+),score=251.01 TRINITY_DN1213_c0_g1_i1:47-3961(+)
MGNTLSTVTIANYNLHTIDVTFDEKLKDGRLFKTLKTFNDQQKDYVVKLYYKQDDDKIEEMKQELNVINKEISGYRSLLPYTILHNDSNSNLVYMGRSYMYTNMQNRLSLRPFLTNDEKLFITYQMINCLVNLHRLNDSGLGKDVYLSHGDLKPSNFLLNASNMVFLADFAPFKPKTIPRGNKTYYSFFFDNNNEGCYLAPERLGNGLVFSKIDPSCDIFSLGCCIYELWTERFLFTYNDILMLTNEFKVNFSDDSMSVTHSPVDTIPEGISKMVLDCLDLDPEKRPTAVDLLNSTIFPQVYSSILYPFFDYSFNLKTESLLSLYVSNHLNFINSRQINYNFQPLDVLQDDLEVVDEESTVFKLVLFFLFSIFDYKLIRINDLILFNFLKVLKSFHKLIDINIFFNRVFPIVVDFIEDVNVDQNRVSLFFLFLSFIFENMNVPEQEDSLDYETYLAIVFEIFIPICLSLCKNRHYVLHVVNVLESFTNFLFKLLPHALNYEILQNKFLHDFVEVLFDIIFDGNYDDFGDIEDKSITGGKYRIDDAPNHIDIQGRFLDVVANCEPLLDSVFLTVVLEKLHILFNHGHYMIHVIIFTFLDKLLRNDSIAFAFDDFISLFILAFQHSENVVVKSSLDTIIHNYEKINNHLSIKDRQSLIKYCAPHLYSAVCYIRFGVMKMIELCTQNLSIGEVHAFIRPIIRHYLQFDILLIDFDTLKHSVNDPINHSNIVKIREELEYFDLLKDTERFQTLLSSMDLTLNEITQIRLVKNHMANVTISSTKLKSRNQFIFNSDTIKSKYLTLVELIEPTMVKNIDNSVRSNNVNRVNRVSKNNVITTKESEAMRQRPILRFMLDNKQDFHLLLHLRFHQSSMTAFTISPNYKYMCSADVEGKIAIWDTTKFYKFVATVPHTVFTREIPVSCVKFINSSSKLVIGLKDGEIRIFNIQTLNNSIHFNEERIIANLDGPIVEIYETKGQNEVIFISKNGEICCYDLLLKQQKWKHKMPAFLGKILSSCFDENDNQFMFLGTQRGLLVLFDMRFRIVSNVWKHSVLIRDLNSTKENPKDLKKRYPIYQIKLVKSISDTVQIVIMSYPGLIENWSLENNEFVSQMCFCQFEGLVAVILKPLQSRKGRFFDPSFGLVELQTIEDLKENTRTTNPTFFEEILHEPPIVTGMELLSNQRFLVTDTIGNLFLISPFDPYFVIISSPIQGVFRINSYNIYNFSYNDQNVEHSTICRVVQLYCKDASSKSGIATSGSLERVPTHHRNAIVNVGLVCQEKVSENVDNNEELPTLVVSVGREGDIKVWY